MGLLGPLGANRSHSNRESQNARDTTARACPSPIRGSPLTLYLEYLGLSLDGFLLGTLNVRLPYITKEVLLSLFLALSVISWISYISIGSNEFRQLDRCRSDQIG